MVKSVAKPITPGILKYQFVKKVKTQWWKEKCGIHLFIIVYYLPPKIESWKKARGYRLLSHSFRPVIECPMCVVYVLCVNSLLDLGYIQGK